MFPTEPIPKQIGAYRILRRLAASKGADVYLGEHAGPLGFQRTCVLKLVPRPEAGGEKDIADELAHEAIICSRMNDPAVVRMYDFFEHEDRLVLVLEHFPSISLQRIGAYFRRRRRVLPENAVWYIAYRLFGALAYAHGMSDENGKPTPLIHRDVQPANVLVGYDGGVRLSGFGIAKIAGTTGTTAIGFIKGTPAYMAPEQARGDKVTRRVDVYAAGLVVWEMLSGKPVIPDNARGQGAVLLKMIAGRRVPPISSVRRGLPREIAAAIDACLEPNPEKRTIDAQQVVRWLRKVANVEEGKRELKEMLVHIRSAPLRLSTALGRSSGPPRAVLARRSMSTRFPGLARRHLVTQNKTHSPAPASTSDAAPPSETSSAIHASPSSYPMPLSGEQPNELDILSTRRPGGETEAFVARLQPPPGVASPPNAALNASRPATNTAAVPDSDRPEGDTTVVLRRDIFKNRQTRTVVVVAVLGGGVFLAAMLVTTVLLFRTFAHDDKPAPRASVSATRLKVGTSTSHKTHVKPRIITKHVPAHAGAPHASTSAAPVVHPSSQPSIPPPPTKLVPGQAALYVSSPPEGNVYIAGVPKAHTDEWLTVSCNKSHYVRVGKSVPAKFGGGTNWLAPGKSIYIKCGSNKRITRW